MDRTGFADHDDLVRHVCRRRGRLRRLPYPHRAARGKAGRPRTAAAADRRARHRRYRAGAARLRRAAVLGSARQCRPIARRQPRGSLCAAARFGTADDLVRAATAIYRASSGG